MTEETAASLDIAPPELPGAGGWAAACVALHVVAAILVYEPILFTGSDAGHYMVLGEALRNGAGYRDLHLPGMPLHTKYPPVYPTLLAGLGWIGGLQLFKLISLSLTAGSVWLVFHLGRRRLGDGMALIGAALFAVAPVLLLFSHLVLSEALFTFLVLLALTWAKESDRYWWPVVVAAAAFFTRTAGLSLLLAFAVHAALEKRPRRALGAGAIALGCIAGWAIYQHVVSPEQPPYLQQLLLVNPYDFGTGTVGASGLLARVATNFWVYVSGQLPASFGLPAPRIGPVPPLTFAAGIVIAGLAVAGWFRSVTRRIAPAGLFAFFYVGLILLWPSVWTDRRLLLPVLPLVILYALDGARGLAEWRFAGRGTATAGAVAVALASAAVMSTASLIPSRITCLADYRDGSPCDPPEHASFYALARYAAEATPERAIIANRSPATFYLLSGRRGDLYRFSQDPEVVLSGLEELGADYVVVDRLSITTLAYLVPVIEAYPDRFEFVHVVGDPPTLLFRMLPRERTASLHRREQ